MWTMLSAFVIRLLRVVSSSHKLRHCGLRVEPLEPRTVPASYFWTGKSMDSSLWSDMMNWNITYAASETPPAQPQPPGPNDDVTLDGTGVSKTSTVDVPNRPIRSLTLAGDWNDTLYLKETLTIEGTAQSAMNSGEIETVEGTTAKLIVQGDATL